MYDAGIVPDVGTTNVTVTPDVPAVPNAVEEKELPPSLESLVDGLNLLHH